MLSKKIIDLEKKYIMQTYERANIVIEHGKGVYLYDGDGRAYLDFISGVATASLGHSHPVIIKAINNQAKKLVNASNLFYTEQQAILAEKLAKISKLSKCFFSNSGAEAVETAIKLARKFTKKQGIIATQNAFHGRTFGALSATWKGKYRKPFEPLVPGFTHITYNDVNALANSINKDTAGFIVEPVQGEAGIIVPDKGYLKKAKEICEENDCLLIVDEIQTNMRTGKFFAYQHEGIRPDIVTVAKGIACGVPIGVTVASKKVADGFNFGDHGSTFGGNSLSCAVANATIDYVQKNKLVEKAGINGDYFIKKLKKLMKSHDTIKEVRGKGLMIGIELTTSAKDVVEKCMKKGLLANKCTEHVLRFLPPLIITKNEIDKCISALDGVLKDGKN